MTNLKFISSVQDFKEICPIMLYNLELDFCTLVEMPKKLSSTQGNIKEFRQILNNKK